jgi:hypothetical protein
MMMDVDVDVMMMNSHTDQSERAENEAPQDVRRPPSVGLLPSLSLCVCVGFLLMCSVASCEESSHVKMPPSINDKVVTCNVNP